MFIDCAPLISQEQSFRNVEHYLTPLNGEEPDELKEEDELNDPSADEGEDARERPEASARAPVALAPVAVTPRRTRAQVRAAKEASDEDRHPELEDSSSSSSPEKEMRTKKKNSLLRAKEELRERLEKERKVTGKAPAVLSRAVPHVDEETAEPATAMSLFGRRLPVAK